jgi:hypothetical protein
MYLHYTQAKCLWSNNRTLCVTHLRSVKPGSLYDNTHEAEWADKVKTYLAKRGGDSGYYTEKGTSLSYRFT